MRLVNIKASRRVVLPAASRSVVAGTDSDSWQCCVPASRPQAIATVYAFIIYFTIQNTASKFQLPT